MINPTGTTEIALAVFGGNNTDMQATDLPQGLSPNCSDVAFLPGSVFTRPALKRLISLGTSSQVVYATTYLKPDSSVSQLVFTLDGGMYRDGFKFRQTSANNRFLACNAFGKEYIATSDGLHGSDVPVQVTPGAFYYRVSQDGVGAPPAVADSATAGQVSPGIHKCVCIFQTVTGYLTKPSPSVTFTAAGGKMVTVSDLPIGPDNVISRIFAFTGASGANYFYLPIPPTINGQIVGTSTVINDPLATSATFDFSDEALFAGTAIDIPGNNLFNLQVLGPCLGFFSYASRLIAWGDRNKVQNFLNMGFEGGFKSSAANVPLGWTVTGTGGALDFSGDLGLAWTAPAGTTISQSAYQDEFGIAIIQPDTQYTYRAWVRGTSIATLSSASTGFSLSATIFSGVGEFVEAQFNGFPFTGKTPVVIPSDLKLTISQAAITTIDEINIIYTNNPYNLSAKVSYVNNPESFDGVTGILGPAGDPHPVLGMEERKDVLCLLTAGPQGSLYETEDTPSGEPATWSVRHIASQCGLTSVWGTTKFEDWFAWTADTGLRMFDGSNVEKMSQEIQPWWDNISGVASQYTVLSNDPYTRRLYILAAQGASATVDSSYVMDYRDLNTASMLANSGTLHVGYTGKVVTTDLTRKWSPWTMTMHYCGLLTINGKASMAFCGASGTAIPNSTIYVLNEGVIEGIDDDYGSFWAKCRYPTYFFISNEEAEQKQLGMHRLLYQYMSMNVSGVGSIFVQAAEDDLDNINFTTRVVPLQINSTMDREFGLRVAGERVSFIVGCQPAGPQPAPADAPAGFKLSSMVVGVNTHPYSPVRGWNK